jgi:crotonobetainyl-CoA:carnitine CoA-transferase CaiB-like acyl-CoA transferase
VLVYTDRHWKTFFSVIGEAEKFEADPRMKDIRSRTTHIEALYGLVAEALEKRDTAEWLEILRSVDIPAMPLHTIESLVEDPHLLATGFFQTIDHPTEGKIRSMAIPVKWSGTPASVERQGARLGEHSAEILAEAGYRPDEIEKMAADGATVIG